MARDAAPTWRDLLRHRYVALIVAFQMLSAIESQWLDYLVYERAAERYEDSEELARFISRFTAIAYGADIVFLLLIAGLLLRRFGLRYGLTANPTFVLGLVGGVVALSSLQGAGATVVFVLIVAARVTDLVLADGAARTSLSAAYQVVPTPMRLAAQAGVEGLAVPLAIGASGPVLLVLQATTGTGGHRAPRRSSPWWSRLAGGRGARPPELPDQPPHQPPIPHPRPAALAIDDANSLAVADRLLDSDDPRDVRLGLDTLALAEHPALPERLDLLTRDARPIVRNDALERLAGADPRGPGRGPSRPRRPRHRCGPDRSGSWRPRRSVRAARGGGPPRRRYRGSGGRAGRRRPPRGRAGRRERGDRGRSPAGPPIRRVLALGS